MFSFPPKNFHLNDEFSLYIFVLCRYGAEPSPIDCGITPVVALLDKLVESPNRRYLYQLVSCLRILLRAISIIEMPFKVL